MNLRRWAEHLLQTSGARDGVELHVKDTLAAFLAGLRTQDGRALARLYREDNPGEMAAAASAIARLSESDDIHVGSCITPGAVIVPVALAFCGQTTEHDFNKAVSAGYASGLCLGVGIGGTTALGHGVWPSLLAAPLMAAVTASCLAGHEADQLAHAMALALAGSNGRIGRPAGTPSGRWFLFGDAVLKGIRASLAADRGFRGDVTLLSEPWLAAQAGHADIDMAIFESPSSPSISDVGYKPFPIARQGLNALYAFQNVLSQGLDPRKIDSIEVFVPGMNAPLLNRPVMEGDRLSRLANMGYQLACAALAQDMLYDVERRDRSDIPVMEFAKRVSVAAAPDLEKHLPDHWAARVVVHIEGRRLEETVVATPFDADAANLHQELKDKWRYLAAPHATSDFFGKALPNSAEMDYPVVWQMIEGHVSMAAQSRREPEPARG